MAWLNNSAHFRWLENETDELLGFAGGAATDQGFGYLDSDGSLIAERGTELWITCRMIHSFSLGVLLGRPGAASQVDHGLASLDGALRDKEHGGWFAAVNGHGPTDDSKAAYAHAFVILSTASATVAGRPGAADLLAEALRISEQYFWREDEGLVVESWNRDFSEVENYRGVNANMHTVEAYLAASDVTGERLWLDRAHRITRRVVDDFARSHQWRIPEHFDSQWNPDLSYNEDTPAHPFRPAGATVGHWFEWARLALHVKVALEARGEPGPDWILEGAEALFERGVDEGWAVDGADGFVYTVTFDGAPLVRERMHWVITEALAAAAALHTVTGNITYDAWYQLWWEYAAQYLLDAEEGSWIHELSAENGPSETVWAGKPDIYHAIQATLIPRLPLAPVLAPALGQGLLR